jgi:hypothetical protein
VAGMPRQRFLFSGTAELPFGAGRQWESGNRWVNGALGGWKINTITLLQTGPWMTPTMSTTADQSNTGISDGVRTGITPRPDWVGNPRAGVGGNVIWSPNAFQPPPLNAGRIGNAGVGILEGPGTIAVATGLAKTLRVDF